MTRRAIALVICGMGFVALARLGAQAAQAADFSGTWVFDVAATATNAKDAKMLPGPIFGETFIAKQTATLLSLDITAGTLHVQASYALDGNESKNQSPATAPGEAPIDVFSRSKWDGARLVVNSRSVSDGHTGPVTVETTRTIWLDEAGRMIIERTGTPKTIVPASRSVYRRQ